jgi:hypothetical protein
VNILVSPLPEAVRIGETSVPIRSGYRTGIQVARAADADLPERIIAGVLLRLYYHDVPADTVEAIERAMEFHRCGRPADTGNRGKRLIDWDHDAGMILADFRREYGIDLAHPETRMHWWVFMAYFGNLSASSETKTAMYYRDASKPQGLKGEDAKRFTRMKKAYALPARTLDDAIARDSALWGDG